MVGHADGLDQTIVFGGRGEGALPVPCQYYCLFIPELQWQSWGK